MATSPVVPFPARHRSLAPDLARALMLAPIAVADVRIHLHGRPYGLRQHGVEDGLLDRVVTVVVVAGVDARACPLLAALVGYGLVHAEALLRRLAHTPRRTAPPSTEERP